MTMLDRMRRHRNWLKWSLALVVLAFVIFYIPAFLRPGDGRGAPTDAVAAVDRYEITVTEFRTAYLAQLAAYRNAYGGNVSETMLRQLGIERQLLAQMVDERAAVAEAERLGISVTDQEVADRIYLLPAFQENGRFIGRERYSAMLAMQRPPLSTVEFEESLRRSLMIDKLRTALTDWMIVSEPEVEREHRRRTEQVKLDLVAFLADRFRDQVTVTDADLSAHFEANKATYKVGEKRKVKYLLVDVDPIRATVKVPSRDLERQYNDNIEMYSTPEQVRASHILFKTEGKKEEEVRARAEAALKDVTAGKDFAELAKKYSEDEASAKIGGDLDYFSRGRMVPEFDEVAFKLEAGSVSDLVKTQYGFHIIKVVDKKAATTKTLDEVRPQIQEQIAWERAQTRAADLASQLEGEIRRPSDLDKAAGVHGLPVQESPLFAKEETIVGIGPSPEAATAAFDLADGQVSGAVRVARGFVFLTVTGKQAPYTPKLEEVKEKVRADVVNLRALADAKARAVSAAAALEGAADFGKAAKAAGLEVKTTELLPRQSAWPEIGLSPEVDGAAFTIPVGTVSDPVSTDRGSVVIRVAERKSPTPAEYAAARDQLRTEMLNDVRGRFFSAYMAKAKQRMAISFNQENLKRITG